MRVLFSRNFADAEFRENKPSLNDEITLLFTDEVNQVQVSNFKRGKYVF